MADIFLSYNREDQDRARLFAEAFAAAGLDVWWDVGLRPGEAYDEVTEQALRAAKAVVVLWSKKSVVSRWVRAEATLAHRNGTLFPCMIDACERPIMFELTQTADLTQWRGDAHDAKWTAFLSDLKRFMATGGGEPAPTASIAFAGTAPAARNRVNRRDLLIAGGATATVSTLIIGGLLYFRGSTALAKNGVAVLPFRNLSGDPGQDYLSIGLSSEVRSVLARNTALRVVAQASCEAVKQRALGAAEMAKALAVSFLLDGNVRQTDDKLHVAAELIDGKTGFSKWSQSFSRPIAELATVQDAIAAAVTTQLAIDNAAGDADGAYGKTEDAIAFDEYLKGEGLYASALSEEADLAALASFERAIERDPKFGAAHAARARALTVLGNTSDDVAKARRYYDSAQQAARRAIETGAASADAHSTLGYVLFQAQLKVADAQTPFERSYDLGRGDAVVLARYAAYAASTRQFAKAKRAVERARELDPLNATIHRAVGFVHYAAGRYAEAIAAVERALSLNPKLSDSHARIGMALIALGRPKDALAAAAQEKSGMMRIPCLSIAQHLLGESEAAEAAMADLKAKYGDAGLYQQAQVLSRWGRSDAAMDALTRAVELGDSGLTYAFIDPTLEPLRARADFKALLAKLGYI